jgi:hypothetical protein
MKHQGNVRPAIWRRVDVKDCLAVELHEIILVSSGFNGDQSFRCCRVLPDAMHHAVAVTVLPAAAPTTESPTAGTLAQVKEF